MRSINLQTKKRFQQGFGWYESARCSRTVGTVFSISHKALLGFSSVMPTKPLATQPSPS